MLKFLNRWPLVLLALALVLPVTAQEGYPLTRLRLVKFCLGEDVFDTAGAEKTAAPEDLLLSNNMGLALTNPQSKAGVNEEEIAKAFPDDLTCNTLSTSSRVECNGLIPFHSFGIFRNPKRLSQDTVI